MIIGVDFKGKCRVRKIQKNPDFYIQILLPFIQFFITIFG
ncbi:hypothetical protein AGMMS50249_0010 [candidate division SR1 bacterium]|nr:hypothetical protein AGMMS50249_0010 [candidate division SR1 bacterium]